MDFSDDFLNKLSAATEEKQAWFDMVEMPNLIKNYRTYHDLLMRLTETLLSKGFIQDDIYKHDKKIMELATLSDAPFPESDRAVVIGMRLSDYERMLDYICNFFRFSISSLTFDRIKILLALDNTFMWTTLGNTGANPNSKGLGDIIGIFRQRGDTLSLSNINDIISNLIKFSNSIQRQLRSISELQRELYKQDIRKTIFQHHAFSIAENASPSAILDKIRAVFQTLNIKKPWYSDLIEELIAEDFSESKEALRAGVLQRLAIKSDVSKEKNQEVDTKEIILEGVRILAALSPQIDTVLNKIITNKEILENQQNSFIDKFAKFLRRVFNIAEKETEYKLKIPDPISHNARTEILILENLLAAMRKRAHFYSTLAAKSMPGYVKIAQYSEEKISDFLARQLYECNRELAFLNALDAFFKANALEVNRSKIRGLKIELTSIKGILLKANKHKAEYSAYIEEQKQLKKLGLINE